MAVKMGLGYIKKLLARHIGLIERDLFFHLEFPRYSFSRP
jgi:hypothetical protein